jgi:hypothetical protein
VFCIFFAVIDGVIIQVACAAVCMQLVVMAGRCCAWTSGSTHIHTGLELASIVLLYSVIPRDRRPWFAEHGSRVN